MKNRVIYSLVAFMVISLAGIIVLQSLWVSKAISDQEEEFENHVNAALNDVNASIDEEEAFFYLEEELAGMGDELVGMGEELAIMRKEYEELHFSSHDSLSVERKYPVEIGYYRDDIPDDERKATTTEMHVEVRNGINSADSILITTEDELNKFHSISTVVRRYVVEHRFSGDLSDRVSKTTLDSLLKEKLKKQGIVLRPEFAVYKKGNSDALSDFKTKGFEEKKKSSSFNKELFPNDRVEHYDFEWFVQFEGTSGFIWSGIQSIVLLCILFTVLILLCFGYSLHFIFKQKRMSQVKNDFINNMTHELKTPLASISLAASSIQHPNVIGNSEEIKRFTNIIKSEQERMNEHVERVLDMAALEYQELKMSLESVDLNGLIKESIEHVQLAIDASNGTVSFDTQIEPASINADKFHLLSALINILDNSVKYQNESLEVKIKLSEVSNDYLIEFSDNGIGMKKATVKHAFDKFYREETGNIHTRKGFGLGLSYVKSIIDLHSGSIELSSEPNVGTRVQIKLPKS